MWKDENPHLAKLENSYQNITKQDSIIHLQMFYYL